MLGRREGTAPTPERGGDVIASKRSVIASQWEHWRGNPFICLKRRIPTANSRPSGGCLLGMTPRAASQNKLGAGRRTQKCRMSESESGAGTRFREKAASAAWV